MPERPRGAEDTPGPSLPGASDAEEPLCMDSSCPCCSRTTAAVDTCGLPRLPSGPPQSPRFESALRGRNTRWQGHSEIAGAPWPVGEGEGWGFIAL